MAPTNTSLVEFKLAAIANSLRSCRLFAGLAPDDLEQIAAITLVKTLEKGEYLFREGETAHGFYIVQQGAINIHRVNAAGKREYCFGLEVWRTSILRAWIAFKLEASSG